MAGRFEHITFLVTDDLPKIAAEFNELFGMNWVLTRNDVLGRYLAVSESGLVLAQDIDPTNPAVNSARSFEQYLCALEVKVPDLAFYHKRMLTHGAEPYSEMRAKAGYHQFSYLKESFHNLPMVVNTYPSESILQSTGSETPVGNGDLVWKWLNGSQPWSSGGKDYSPLAEIIPAKGDSKVVRVTLDASGRFADLVDDFRTIFDMVFTIVTDRRLGLRMALSDQGYQFCENLEVSNPSPLARNFGRGLIAGVEIKVADMVATDKRLAAKRVRRICEVNAAGGYRAFYYDSGDFHDIPLVVSECDQSDYLEAIDPNLLRDPETYVTDVRWAPGHSLSG
jgi:hypothetical protein